MDLERFKREMARMPGDPEAVREMEAAIKRQLRALEEETKRTARELIRVGGYLEAPLGVRLAARERP